MMHVKAMEKIKNITEGALQNCAILNRWPVFTSYSVHVESLANEALKHKGEWLIESDVYSIFIDHVYKILILVYPDDNEISGNLKDLLSGEQFSSLSDSISRYFESIPREYDVYLPLPSVKGIEFDSLEIHPGVWLKTFSKKEDVPGGYQEGLRGLFNNKFETNKVYLCIREHGYTGGSIENSCTREALSGFKLLLHEGMHRMLFKLEDKMPVSLGLGGSFGHHQIPKISLVSVDLLGDKSQIILSELTLNLTRFIHKICLDIGMEFVKKEKEAGEEQFKSLFLKVFKKSAQMTQQKSEYVCPIKSAIQWAIDSKAEENKTISFIHNCIGLESVLGDDMGGMPVTSTLADRCSYLIGTDPKGRKTIKDKFKKLYAIRSKLVHGNVVRLSEDDSKYHRWGQIILDMSISKEIKNYKIEDV